MKKPHRTPWLLGLLIVCCAALTAAAGRAAAQSVTRDPRASPVSATAPSPPASTAAPASSQPSPPAQPPAAAGAEPGARGEDATVAPDKKESADNNVSFPVDI
jgi:hypothetical protein